MARRPRHPVPGEVFADLLALGPQDAAEKWPPGYRTLDDVVREYGRDLAQANLMSGQWLAFRVDLKAGDLEPIPATAWSLGRGRTWLEEGATRRAELLPDYKTISYTVIVRVSEQQPSLTDNPKDADRPKVRLAKQLMDATFSQDEWRQMGVRAVRKRCEGEATKRRVQLPSPDSFSRAMERRRK